VNEISFNAPLLRELRHVEFVNNRLRDGDLTHSGYREIFLHRVGGGADLSLYPASSKLDGDMTLIDSLHDLGFSAMDAWLEKNFHHLGVASTMPLEIARG
jgi:NTE family protein